MKSSGGGRGPGGQDRGPQNLSRAKVAVHKMMLKTAESNKETTNNKNKSRAKVDPRESMFKGPQGLSRKERRRQAKQEKKSKMIALHSKKPVSLAACQTSNVGLGSSVIFGTGSSTKTEWN